MIYGEHDPQRREEFILRRVRAGRRRIPVGLGNWLWTRCYVGDVASAVLAAIGSPAAHGQVLNVGEPATTTAAGWAAQILAAAGHDAELVQVPERVLPQDMWPSKGRAQHLLFDSHRAMDVLGWRPGDPAEGIARSVRWHLAHPPQDPDPGFAEDDTALEPSEPAR
jgi:UDP-glucose 4-epimerase